VGHTAVVPMLCLRGSPCAARRIRWFASLSATVKRLPSSPSASSALKGQVPFGSRRQLSKNSSADSAAIEAAISPAE